MGFKKVISNLRRSAIYMFLDALPTIDVLWSTVHLHKSIEHKQSQSISYGNKFRNVTFNMCL